MSLIKNICNPSNETNVSAYCSIACIDAEYAYRFSIYPDTVDVADCPPFWTSHKVHIKLIDYETEFMKGIAIFACVMGMG